MVVADILSYTASVFAAAWLLPGVDAGTMPVFYLSLLAVAIAIPIHWSFGLYASIVRYMGLSLLVIGIRSTAVVTLLFVTVSKLTALVAHPLKVGIIVGAFSLILIVGGRLTARLFLSRQNKDRERIIIYGAGAAGVQIIASLLSADDYLPVALIDDDRSLHGKRIHGLTVYSSDDLPRTLRETGSQGILLAMPGATRRQRRKVLERLSEFPVRVQTMPDIKALVSGKAQIDDIRDVDTGDLLGRDEVPPNPILLAQPVTEKSVAVTGAGGSIGAELCRQILKHNPRRLVCIELSEAALYQVDQELTRIANDLESDCEIVPLLGSVDDRDRMQEVFSAFDVQTIFHAAAYKHVPIVEKNLFEGIRNNVFGTWGALRAAEDAGVGTFVLVSTDKAVNPMNIMGVTKRLAELILQAYDRKGSATRVCMVRFGNVLESSGSVVPLFRKQIRDGGPVTVTHRDIIRYFMTIPEAAQLVIQAAAMARGGDVFVLDMGQPVRIEDLARRMINLMGLTVRDESHPEGDIEIQFIGLRPAEKLYEELLIGSNVTGTDHPRILRADEDDVPIAFLRETLDALAEAAESRDYARAKALLKSVVKEFQADDTINDLLWLQKTGTDDTDRNILDFPKST